MPDATTVKGGRLSLVRHRLPILIIAVIGLAAVFSQVEIQIEGAAGWAANLPTWRIEHHWLLDYLWAGRPLTGYHLWVFFFMFLVFHMVFFFHGHPSLRLEARVMGSLMVFWAVEDFFWFVFNPAYGFSRFSAGNIPWHHHWFLGMPVDYTIFLILGGVLVGWSFRRPGR